MNAVQVIASRLEELRAPRGRPVVPFLGAAFVASVAYVDPGNFATNMQAGSTYGFLLLWVVAAANATAMLVQYLSAKLGLATGANLPELCRDRAPRAVTLALWIQAELVCMATDIAEITGTAIALRLLFGLPLLAGGLAGGLISSALLLLQPHHRARFITAICLLLGVILAAFFYATLRAHVSPAAAAGGLAPRLRGGESQLLATGIVGATVMPHVIYLHSELTKRVPGRDRRRRLRDQRLDVGVAMVLAGLVNVAMLMVAATALQGSHTSTLMDAYHGLSSTIGTGVALAFAVAMLASGVASSSVGTYAGQVVAQGFVSVSIPLWARRIATLLPALVLLASGANPTTALVVSQVTLSFGIPAALVPLLVFTARRDVMGAYVNRPVTTWVAGTATVLIIMLNGLLLVNLWHGG